MKRTRSTVWREFRDHPSTRDLQSPLRTSLGSTSIIVNGQGVGLWEDRYLPFGDVRYHSDTVTNTVQTQTLRCTQGYTGQWLEEGLAASSEGGLDRGLYFYGERWYDASLGRFVQPDTIVPEPGNPQSLNRYAYVLNNPLRYIDPSGHDPLDQTWQDEFERMHHRQPTAEDIQIRLFSIAFPNEWNWSAFYNPDGSYIQGSLENVFRDRRPANWSWEDMPGALERMAGWYNADEEEFYTRDIGSLFAGLLNRLEAPEARHAIYNGGRGSARVWVYLDRSGLSPVLMGNSDDDANVHHWAWGLTMGAEYGPAGSMVNILREATQFNGDWHNTWSDVSIGNQGAALGAHFRILGLTDVTRAWNYFMLDRRF